MRNDFNSNYLAHFGIMGMKWGVRRYQNDDGSLTPAGRERYGSAFSKKAKTAKNILKSDVGSRSSKSLKAARRKDIDELSTQELKEINNRLSEEKRYQDLTKGTTADGKKFVKDMSRTVVSSVVTGIAIELGKNYVKHRLSKNKKVVKFFNKN